ncbi:hypothetical protein BDP27DRAFT_1450661 [Rhodocollybia butyracea]|uniref:Uncharacterized protein n=1 Tax=Rhodocollybia butyracea TaxID=206335 RepID=A0A9P5PL77_9AGAR|nr:hypothetical protein BDP27DRAFT_1450661 [Rhodocollybia butyracea]
MAKLRDNPIALERDWFESSHKKLRACRLDVESNPPRTVFNFSNEIISHANLLLNTPCEQSDENLCEILENGIDSDLGACFIKAHRTHTKLKNSHPLFSMDFGTFSAELALLNEDRNSENCHIFDIAQRIANHSNHYLVSVICRILIGPLQYARRSFAVCPSVLCSTIHNFPYVYL